jgi:elongation factor G
MISPLPHNSLIELAIEPKSTTDMERLGLALLHLADENPAIAVKIDAETGQAIIGGVSERHLDEVLDRLRHEFRVETRIGALQLAYRETLSQAGTVDYTHKDTIKGTGKAARVVIEFGPGATGSGFVFQSRVSDPETPRDCLPAIEKGLLSVRDNGLIAGFPVIDVKATLMEAHSREGALDAQAFEIAARAAFREARHVCAPALLEPVMTVEVTAPTEFRHALKDDLTRRGADFPARNRLAAAGTIFATVPLSKLIGYARVLERLADGRAEAVLAFDRYQQVPIRHNPEDEPFPPAIGMRA